MDVATWLTSRREVERVLHPALPGTPGHAFWTRDFKGASGLFSVALKPGFTREGFRSFVDHLELFGMGFSWGGFESLVMPFDPRQERPGSNWPYDGFAFRLHIGLEAKEDLIADLDKAFRFLSVP
ncbi:PLP-dependent transferase [Paraburkholderia sp. A2WS-5]|uniref:PLP-dependent transferase n=1 Tax=unclassified Paraburkholderia TaxID=2615204 RepID=UPI003B800052